ncbi:hypothetical protein JMF89_02845 [Clostridiaceae bacterium UIB06]|uniref:Uncharacterized protein n=1 Tax=Clostridium thailandense TaxID=2794346 RepID=A0A949TLC7_9CLOT|nr:hypothetical protein [Clostridium thailandense]MBV7271407.1 hypothetical protein [Clostridium thailandense]MCH5136149.1 hypothetical protein [Clostridiaceae bacterium UIB06]
MLRLTWIELFLRSIPELFVIVWGIHVLSEKRLNIRNYIFSSLILGVLTFFVRWLPIYFGVHMIINIILIISIMIIIEMPIIKAVRNTLIMIFILCLSEFINLLILNLLKIDTSFKFLNPVMKCILCSPSLIATLAFIITVHYLYNKEYPKRCNNNLGINERI